MGDVTLLYYVAGYSISEEHSEDMVEKWPARSEELADKLETHVGPGEDVIAAATGLLEEI